MARPRKADNLLAKRREISVKDADWKMMKEEAAAVGLSVSRYLIERRAAATPRRSAALSPETMVRHFETVSEIRDQMNRITRTVSGTETSRAFAILLELVAIERRLAALNEAVARR